jgi:hypothetical protein
MRIVTQDPIGKKCLGKIRAEKRFASINRTSIPGGAPFRQGAVFESKSHLPTSADRSSEQLRQNEGAIVMAADFEPSRSRIISAQEGSKWRSRSDSLNLSSYPATKSLGPPLCQPEGRILEPYLSVFGDRLLPRSVNTHKH